MPKAQQVSEGRRSVACKDRKTAECPPDPLQEEGAETPGGVSGELYSVVSRDYALGKRGPNRHAGRQVDERQTAVGIANILDRSIKGRFPIQFGGRQIAVIGPSLSSKVVGRFGAQEKRVRFNHIRRHQEPRRRLRG